MPKARLPVIEPELRKRDRIAEKPSERALVASARRSRECPTEASIWSGVATMALTHSDRRKSRIPCFDRAGKREGASDNRNKAKNGRNRRRIIDQAAWTPAKRLMS